MWKLQDKRKSVSHMCKNQGDNKHGMAKKMETNTQNLVRRIINIAYCEISMGFTPGKATNLKVASSMK
jgi:hypothetical protein